MIETRRDVLILPFLKSWVGGPSHAEIPEHGRVRKGGKFIDQFPTARADRLRPRTRPGTYLYGGPLKIHFGHVMVDSIIRLWAYDPLRHQKVFFPKLQESKNITPWIYDIFEVFGITRDRVLVSSTSCVLEEVDFAVPGARLEERPAPEYLQFLKRLPLHHVRGTPKNVYFGRTHILNQGTLMGETYFSELLSRSGFTYVCPERLDIHTQTSILRNAERVVFMEGSSIYSIELLSQINADVYMISRRPSTIGLFQPHISSRACFHLLGNPQAVERRENTKGRIKQSSPSYTQAPESIHQAMADAGLVSERFDLAAFEAAEKADTYAYFGEAVDVAMLQLNAAQQGRSPPPPSKRINNFQ